MKDMIINGLTRVDVNVPYVVVKTVLYDMLVKEFKEIKQNNPMMKESELNSYIIWNLLLYGEEKLYKKALDQGYIDSIVSLNE